MSHEHHDHSHSHELNISHISRAFIIGIALNLLFVVIEAASGFLTGSLALLTDAGHNLADVASLVIALLAIKLATAKPNERFTYGYKKSTILAALINAVILLAATVGIVYEGIERMFNPVAIEGGVVAIVAGVGILINGVTALLFFREKDKDLNIKGAYLHLAADALVSVGVVIAGIAMLFTSWFWLDSAISFIVAIVIFISTWQLLKDTLRLSLDGVPHNVDLIKVREQIMSTNGVIGVHHLHIWGLSTTQVALTCHVVLDKNITLNDVPQIKADIRANVKKVGVEHTAIEVESTCENCEDKSI